MKAEIKPKKEEDSDDEAPLVYFCFPSISNITVKAEQVYHVNLKIISK